MVDVVAITRGSALEPAAPRRPGDARGFGVVVGGDDDDVAGPRRVLALAVGVAREVAGAVVGYLGVLWPQVAEHQLLGAALTGVALVWLLTVTMG